ncbi:hypothetical protein PXH66_06875 [Synoicihabitans lomoniglobus]|uniref:Uncharacterized protein n=1 Tax=Synoicihabitans lomoniglobus TaxID=2909285 RepID=A0AAF0I794_9BACT|nr:hypothetical protein PXH66_06875 [Opitutaceae bacterium LMO-M01]
METGMQPAVYFMVEAEAVPVHPATESMAVRHLRLGRARLVAVEVEVSPVVPAEVPEPGMADIRRAKEVMRPPTRVPAVVEGETWTRLVATAVAESS